jgi:hypothetical protein
LPGKAPSLYSLWMHSAPLGALPTARPRYQAKTRFSHRAIEDRVRQFDTPAKRKAWTHESAFRRRSPSGQCEEPARWKSTAGQALRQRSTQRQFWCTRTMEVSIICTAASRPDTTNSRPTIWRSSQTSAAGSLQQTESLFAENHEHFFNAIDPTETYASLDCCCANRL